MNVELKALQDADFGWVLSQESVWSNEDVTDAGPNQDHIDKIIGEFAQLSKSPNPPCRAFLGQAGVGKTHFVGVLRQRAWAADGWFVLLELVGITDFWKSAALSFITSLLQEMPDGRRQYEAVIGGIARQFKIEKEVNIALASKSIEPKKIIDLLVGGLMRKDPANVLKHQDVFRALVLLRSHDLATIGLAHSWLQGYDVDPDLRRSLGFLTPPPSGVNVVRGLSWVMGLAGPTLIAVDQIDGVLGAGNAPAVSEFGESTTFAQRVTGGLLDLAVVIGRGMIVLTVLPSSWEIIMQTGPASLEQRFLEPEVLILFQHGDFVRRLIADRLKPAYDCLGVTPSSPTGPFTDAAILSASRGMTPRTILMRCNDYRKRCLAAQMVLPCDDLLGEPHSPITPKVEASHLDRTFVSAKDAADLTGLLDEKNDGKLGMLLRDTFDLYAKQIPPHDDYDVVSRADPAQKMPPLHGRLTLIDHTANDTERHYCFRALQHSNAVALCARFKAALTASGIAARLEHQRLIVVRRGLPPGGPKTKELFDAFRDAGGIEIDPDDADLRTMMALRVMRDAALTDSRYDEFERWLIERKPLCETSFFKAAGLCPPPLPTMSPQPEDAKGQTRPPTGADRDGPSFPENKGTAAGKKPTHEKFAGQPKHLDGPSTTEPPVSSPPSSIPIGYRIASGEAVNLPTAVLPRHTAIIAGAGSGKTVLLKRIVEEAALAGIPAIVIDPNNDLSRLGDAWPEAPSGFTEDDRRKAKIYAATVEVVVWTPGMQGGNPLSLSVLPDFAAIGDDPDELDQAVAMAVDTLAPLAGAKNDIQVGVLSAAVRHFAKAGGAGLKDMTALLADLPEGVSSIRKADEHAAKLADGLVAAVETNPLLKVGGAVLDPAVLFFGPDLARARISVINLSGLASDKAKQDFVNRLQMTLFGWIKKHPSPTGLLYVIDEAQTFIPSSSPALSKTSGTTLVAQARKYGLGMVVVTQAPRGIDNTVVSNCTTQFLGKQNAPATIEAAKEMIGGRPDDLGRLATGEFYFKTELSGKPVKAKVRTPICLSYHAANPPTPEEVVARARASRV
jgi:hypothetical protein